MKILKLLKGKSIDLCFEKYSPEIPEKKFVPALDYKIVLHDTDIVIGHCSARLGMNEEIFYVGNVGYGIDENHRGNGYAVEAVKLLLKVFKVNEVEKIYITNLPDNLSSKRVCEKVGAKFLGTFEIPEGSIRRKEYNETFMNVFEMTIEK